MKLPKHYRREPRVIAVDIDGTICHAEAWTVEDVLNAEPVQKVIDKVNKLYETKFIVMCTARRENLAMATIEWLKKNNVRYHAISFGNMPADLYINDKAINVEDFEL